MTEPHYSARELAGLPEMPGTERGVQLRAMRDGWPCRKRQGTKALEYPLSALPAAAQTALLLGQEAPLLPAGGPQREDPEPKERRYDPDELWNYWSRKTNKIKAMAEKRHNLVLAVESLRKAGMTQGAARRQVAEQAGVSVRSLQRLEAAVEGYHRADWLPALVPGYAGRTVTAEIDPQAWDMFKGDYLRKPRTGAPTASACYERLTRAAKKHGWPLPTLKTLMKRLEREVPPSLIVLLREGEDAYKASRPAQERDRSVFHALEAVNGDGYQFSSYVAFESGEVCQPKTWYWQDLYSNKILAWRTDVSENKDSIRLATGDLIEKWGIPEHFWIDNTRAAANKDMTGGVKNRYRFKVKDDEPMGLIPQLGAQVHWTTPGHGQAKPIERAFGAGGPGEYIDKHPQFEGRGSKARPIPIAEFEQVMAVEIAAFNARLGRRSKVAAGRSYDAVFAQSYERSAIRKASPAQRAQWLLAPEPVRCGSRDGAIKLMDNRYWCEELTAYKGRKVVARFDPAALHAGIMVETLDGLTIGHAECVLAAGFNDRDAARATAKENARIRKHYRQIAEAELRLSAKQVAALLPQETPEPPKPESRVVAPVFSPSARVVNSGLIDDDDTERDPNNLYRLSREMLEIQRKNRL